MINDAKVCAVCDLLLSFDSFYKWSNRCIDCTKKYKKEYDKKNSSIIAEQKREYYAKNKERIQEQHRDYYKNNADKLNQVSKIWKAGNPEARARSKHKRRLLTSIKVSYSSQEWQTLLLCTGGTCLACGSNDELTVDHITAVVRGGDNTIDNIQPLCQSCNSSKGTKTVSYL